MCFTPISARGIRKFSPIARLKIRGVEFDAGEIPKNIPFPWQEYQFPGRNTISLAGSSYIFEGMFPLNKRNIFFFYLIDSWAGKNKRYIPKSMHVSTITFVFTARKSFSIKNIDTFEENVVTFLNLQQ